VIITVKMASKVTFLNIRNT